MALNKRLLISLLLISGVAITPARAEEGAKPNPNPNPATNPGAVNVGLYPNDFGPAEIDVSSYPKEMRLNYKLFAFKCQACHTIARPINTQFLELSQDEQTALRAKEPELFKNDKVWHIEDKIWNRYVKRMMSKPGCPVQGEDGKKIWQFLVYDSKARKTGVNRQTWGAQRKKLVDDFKKDYREAYEKVFGV